MEAPNLLPTPHSPDPFRFHLAAAVKRHGEDGYRILEHGREYCPACGFQIPTNPRLMLHRRPAFCENCIRMLVDSHAEHLSLLAPFSSEVQP